MYVHVQKIEIYHILCMYRRNALQHLINLTSITLRKLSSGIVTRSTKYKNPSAGNDGVANAVVDDTNAILIGSGGCEFIILLLVVDVDLLEVVLAFFDWRSGYECDIQRYCIGVYLLLNDGNLLLLKAGVVD